MLHAPLLRKGDYLYGSFVKPELVDGYINGMNPGDRTDLLGRFPFSVSSVGEAVGSAREVADTWRRSQLAERIAAVNAFKGQLSRFAERMAVITCRETGKPLWEARQELIATLRALELVVEESRVALAVQESGQSAARSESMPRGVVALLCPYNFPVFTPTTQTAIALLSGNVVVAKPSKYTPGVGQTLAELWDRTGLPRGALSMIQGSGKAIGQRLVNHDDIDAVVFSGSHETAQLLGKTALQRPELPMALMCGGKGTAIVLDDADIERTTYEVLIGAFLTTGQRHNSTARVIATSKIFDTFLAALSAHARRLRIGYGMDAETFMGPLISDNFRKRYRRYCKAVKRKGAETVCEAGNHEPTGRRGYYVRPAIYLVDHEQGHPFLNDEPPGPVLLMYEVPTWEAAVELHNRCTYRLSTSVFTQLDNPLLDEIVGRLRTGTVNVNRGTVGASIRMPSAGLGRSSNAQAGGLSLFRFLTTPRALLTDSRTMDETPMLPGVNWDNKSTTEEEATIEIDEVDLETDSEEVTELAPDLMETQT